MSIALEPIEGAPLVCDPACGDGAFLLAAGRELVGRGIAPELVARDLLWGCDVDAGAVAQARAAVRDWAGVDPADHLVVADGLVVADAWPQRFDVVVGNPPFLNQLERATVRRRHLPASLRGVARPYTDTAWLFLVAARQLVRDGGRVVLVQPQSLLAARDAAPVREAIGDDLAGLWWCDEELFDARVHVCAPVLGRPSGVVQRWIGRDVVPADPVAHPGVSWGALAPSAGPDVRLDAASGTLASLASATAGFRDQFYGLAPHVVDEATGDDPLLITSGLIDAGGIAWGERTTRFAGTTYQHPRVVLERIDAKLGAWVRDRLRPKVVLATQTKVLEAAVDVDGRWVPSTPVIAVHPRAESELWRVAAVLSAPAVSAWAARRFAGAGLSPKAIKLSAKQVLTIPLPARSAAWSEAADALRDGDVHAAAVAMDDAYGATAYEWWSATGWAHDARPVHHGGS